MFPDRFEFVRYKFVEICQRGAAFIFEVAQTFTPILGRSAPLGEMGKEVICL